MGAGGVIVAVIFVLILVGLGLGVWWLLFHTPGLDAKKCEGSPFYKNQTNIVKKELALKTCSVFQPPNTEKHQDSNIDKPTGFSHDWEMTAVPEEFPVWDKEMYYAAHFVNMNNGHYGKMSDWSSVPSSKDHTLPSVAWDAGKFSDASMWGLNVYRASKSDGSDKKLVGKGRYNPANNKFGYIDFFPPS